MDKLKVRSLRAHFIGYLKESMGYYFYLSEDYNVIVSCHAIFLKKEFIQDRGSGRNIELKEKIFKEHRVQKPELISKLVDVVPLPPCRSNRISHPPKRYLDILTEDLEKVFLVRYRDIRNDPKTYDEAILDVDSEKWMEVMKSEINSIHSN